MIDPLPKKQSDFSPLLYQPQISMPSFVTNPTYYISTVRRDSTSAQIQPKQESSPTISIQPFVSITPTSIIKIHCADPLQLSTYRKPNNSNTTSDEDGL